MLEQVVNVCHSNVVQAAWERGQDLTIHGWCYGVGDGLLRDLGLTVTDPDGAAAAYPAAVDFVFSGQVRQLPLPS